MLVLTSESSFENFRFSSSVRSTQARFGLCFFNSILCVANSKVRTT